MVKNIYDSVKKIIFFLFIGFLFSLKIYSQKSIITYKDAIRISKGEVTEREVLLQNIMETSTTSKINQIRNTISPKNKVAAPAPANDLCANAIALTIGGGDYAYNNTGATTTAGDPIGSGWSTCGGGPGNNVLNSVWFKFTVAGGPLNITVSSQGPNNSANSTGDKATYAVYSGACGSLTEIGTTRGGTYGNYNSKSINIASLANGTYLIETDGLCSQTGNYRIRVDVTPAGASTLWYAAGAIPTLSTGVPITTCGQWGTYAATTELSPMCGPAGLGFSDWYQFVYDPATQNSIGITDQALQSGFYIGLYNSAGTELVCNKWGQADYASYTWDLSAQEGIAMHLANISLKELSLTTGATYYVRIASTSSTYENVNSVAGKIYTVRLGNYAPSGDSYLDNATLTLTQANTFSWLTGQTNRYSGHSMITEPEKGNLTFDVDNSLMYKFNTATVTAVNVAFRNLTYYNHSASTALGQVAVFTAPQSGTSKGSSLAFSGATFTLSLTGLTVNTDYWIVVDGGGTYGGTKLTFDISVSVPFSALPIELVSFKGYSGERQNILNWTTASEKNSDYFSIEKSSDGLLFKEFERVKGAGNSSQQLNYKVVDTDITSEITYYRLKQTDFDGAYSFSEIIAVSTENKNNLNAIIIPNPSGIGTANLNFTSTTEGVTYLKVYSITGQLIDKREIRTVKGLNLLDLNDMNLSKGMYFFNLMMNEKTQVIKFIRE